MTLIRPAAALFDFDGTLIDREPLIEAAVLELCRRRSVAAPDGAVVIGRAWQDIFADLGGEAAMGCTLLDLVGAVREVAAELIADGHTPRILTGGAELVARLAAAGVAVALVSGSTRAELADGIEVLGIAQHLSLVLGAEDYGRGKPDPECYLAAAAHLGVDPAGCVVFEDSTVGIAAGRSAGMWVVATADANPPPHHPAHQDHTAAHHRVAHLAEVDDALLAALVAGGDPTAARP